VIGLVSPIQEMLVEPDPLAPAAHQQYLRAIFSAGATPCLIPLRTPPHQLREMCAGLDGLFLTGGADIDPAHYGEPRHERCESGEPARDRTELLLFHEAQAASRPILGICRGLQLINVAAGGTLHQDLAALRPGSIRHDYFSTTGRYRRDLLVHSVEVAAASHLARVLGDGLLEVNSMHHQGIKDLGRGLSACAWAPDGVIEGIEGIGPSFLLAVQWHPEELLETSEPNRRLFRAFVEACRQLRAERPV
jgi:putative glutamine amidotransferase